MVLSAACCLGIWAVVPRHLEITTPIVGYPIFADFDYEPYFDAFYLVALIFPGLAILWYLLLGRLSRLGLRRPGRVLPLPIGSEPAAPAGDWVLAAAGRVLLPALVVAIETGAAAGGSTLSGLDVVSGLGYVAVVLITAAVLSQRRGRPYPKAVSITNGYLALCVIPLVYAVSRATNLTVASEHRTIAYPWFPWWFALPSSLLALALVVRAHRRGMEDRLLEQRVVFAVAGTVLVFLLVSSLPGALGGFGAFDDSQYLAGAQLTFGHGLLPWKDVYLLHGPFEDDFQGELGFAIFSHTRWGAVAGIVMFVTPAGLSIFYLFSLYFARGRRLLALLCVFVILAGEFTIIARFSYLPLLLMLLDAALRSQRRRVAMGLGALVVLECILTPEAALMAICVLITLVAFDFSRRAPGTAWRQAFPTTCSTVLGGIAAGIPFLVYLVATGSLVGFLDYYRIFGSNHALWGALPFQWSVRHDLSTTIFFALPVIVWLGIVALVSLRARARHGLTIRQWCLLCAGLFVVIYFQKGLDRLDPGHVGEVFDVSTPAVLLAGIELASALDDLGTLLLGGVRRAAERAATSGARALRAIGGLSWRQPASALAAVGLFVGLPSITAAVRATPSHLHASSPVPGPSGNSALLGYTLPGSVNLGEIDTLGQIINAYGGTGPVFDFTNEPGITYFLLNREPGASSYHIESAQTPLAQQQVISELGVSRPRLVIFTDYDFGLPLVDYVVGPLRNYLVARYLLTHYRPFADIDGQLVMIRSDLFASTKPVTSLHLPRVVGASRLLYFQTYNCAIGDIGNFLSAPTLTGATSVTLRPQATAPVNTTIEGWAVDDHAIVPAKAVFAVINGRVVARTVPSLLRPDIVSYFHSNAVADSGFELQLDVPKGANVKLFALNADGTVSRIQPDPELKLPSTLRSTAVLHKVQASATTTYAVQRGPHLSGWVTVDQHYPSHRTYRLVLPAGQHWSTYAWAVVSGGATARPAEITMDDGSSAFGHEISFNSLSDHGTLELPVGSCLQWYGMPRTIDLTEAGGSSAPPLIRLYS